LWFFGDSPVAAVVHPHGDCISVMINWKIVIVFAFLHSVIVFMCFGFAFAEGTRNSDALSFRISEGIVSVLSWPILAPVFLLTENLGLITVLAFVANSAFWGFVSSFLVTFVKRIVQD
jgi:hypothetical protein